MPISNGSSPETSNNTEAGNSPKTGDNSDSVLWIVLGISSLVGVAVILVVSREKKIKNTNNRQ
ncbi:LPXTG cell wall anchor domain-containing protein [Caproicibacterium sp. BJN0003]|uniref:LPXTG cell wall anchor domain-containing protein n=1 Tax=Caproicibacterium sp. BJN0003 TaxID=2994078 RepID=UPI003A4C6EBE